MEDNRGIWIYLGCGLWSFRILVSRKCMSKIYESLWLRKINNEFLNSKTIYYYYALGPLSKNKHCNSLKLCIVCIINT